MQHENVHFYSRQSMKEIPWNYYSKVRLHIQTRKYFVLKVFMSVLEETMKGSIQKSS